LVSSFYNKIGPTNVHPVSPLEALYKRGKRRQRELYLIANFKQGYFKPEHTGAVKYLTVSTHGGNINEHVPFGNTDGRASRAQPIDICPPRPDRRVFLLCLQGPGEDHDETTDPATTTMPALKTLLLGVHSHPITTSLLR